MSYFPLLYYTIYYIVLYCGMVVLDTQYPQLKYIVDVLYKNAK